MTPMSHTPTAALLVLTLLLPACAGGGSDRGAGGSPGGAAPSTAKTFDGDTAAFMRAGLHQFSDGDSAWASTRAQWLALGDREASFLVTNMFGALLAAQRSVAPELVERARHELVLIGAPSVPLLADVLAAGTVTTVYDEIAETDKPFAVDDDARREAAEVLALIGAPAARATSDVLSRAETKSGRRFALQSLGNMGDRGGATSRDTLVRYTRDDDWVLRVAAVTALRTLTDAESERALAEALGDDEDLVRQNALGSLVMRRASGTLPAIRSSHARARDAGRLVESRRLERAIRTLESRR